MRERWDASDRAAASASTRRRGVHPHRPAAPEQCGPRHDPGPLGGPRGHAVPPHERLRRGPRPPEEEAAELALRTQQILAFESGAARTVDPLAGSYFVEELTNRIEAEARSYLAEIDERGGPRRPSLHEGGDPSGRLPVPDGGGGWVRTVVGVNRFRKTSPRPEMADTDYSGLEASQRGRVGELRSNREPEPVERALARLKEAALGSENLMPRILEAAKAMATLGEISHALRESWGSYAPKG
jgi:methylmalonyl-CoA mutase, N-terminal domain